LSLIAARRAIKPYTLRGEHRFSLNHDAPMRIRARYIAIPIAVILLLAAIIFCYRGYKYPYGWSHCCDKALYFALIDYAETHDRRFPAGEATPEASLSLLYKEDPNIGYILRGKSVPETVVLERLKGGQLLSPDTCGWNYVEGLTLDDDPRIALFWDKAGLDHNGGRLSGGRHVVCFVGCSFKHIPENEWDDFLAQQKTLLANRKRKR
jgi:hypothetical protein